MSQQTRGGWHNVTRSYRTDIGPTWWAALVVVTVVLGVVGRGVGFWGAFLWSVFGFVLGSLAAIAVSSRVAPARSEAEAFADVDHELRSRGSR